MKIKIITQEPLYLAGVIHYGELDLDRAKEYGKTFEFKMDDDELNKEIAHIKINAKKMKQQVLNDLKRSKVHFDKDYKQHKNEWKKEPYAHNFEGAINRFGDVMEAVGRHIEKNARNWEDNLKDWSQNFEEKMEGFGEKMEAWGEDFGKKMEDWGEQFEAKWDVYDDEVREASIRCHPIYERYLSIYESILEEHKDLMSKKKFYEVQILESTDMDVTSLVMVGAKMSSLEHMTYPVATMTFNPDAWVSIKLTKDEYKKDWLGSLEKVDQLKAYELDAYYVIRHKYLKEQEGDMIKLFVPLKVKKDER